MFILVSYLVEAETNGLRKCSEGTSTFFLSMFQNLDLHCFVKHLQYTLYRHLSLMWNDLIKSSRRLGWCLSWIKTRLTLHVSRQQCCANTWNSWKSYISFAISKWWKYEVASAALTCFCSSTKSKILITSYFPTARDSNRKVSTIFLYRKRVSRFSCTKKFCRERWS